jgi:hypothetical protein
MPQEVKPPLLGQPYAAASSTPCQCQQRVSQHPPRSPNSTGCGALWHAAEASSIADGSFGRAAAEARQLTGWVCLHAQGLFKYHQYQVVGRHLPTEADPSPTLYRMKVWAKDAVRAKSKFW